MVKYIIKRLLLSVLIIFGVSVILYVLLRCVPGDYVEQKFTANPSVENPQERLEQMRALYGIGQQHYRRLYQMDVRRLVDASELVL